MRSDSDRSTQDLVTERAEAIFETSDDLLSRFDRNGDGVLDGEEWEAARAVLEREVLETIPADELLDGRYAVVAPLGHGGQAQTWLAHDREDGTFVAIKELDFEKAQDWKAMELFDREAKVLAGIDHPAIPTFLDAFDDDETAVVRKFIVQEFVDGRTLETQLRQGILFDESSIRDVAAQVIDILVYLHGLEPPTLHRDIKPANLITRNDGSIALVDFGAVAAEQSVTVVGTSGYMPPEQLMGHAGASSDLYALGMTLLHLLTRRHPASLIRPDLSVDWTAVHCGAEFGEWLQDVVAAMPEDRFTAAITAKRALEKLGPPPTTALAVVPRDEYPETSLQLVTTGPDDVAFDVFRGPGEIELFIGESGLPPAARGALTIVGFAAAAAIMVSKIIADGNPVFAVVMGLLIAVMPILMLSRRTIVDIKGDLAGVHVEYLQGFSRKTDHVALDDINVVTAITHRNGTTTTLKTEKGDFVLTEGKGAPSFWVKDQFEEWLDEVRSLQ
jgi:serine/threonine protein kinase